MVSGEIVKMIVRRIKGVESCVQHLKVLFKMPFGEDRCDL